MKRKNVVIGIVLFVVVIVLGIFFIRQKRQDEIKLGAILAMSGENGFWGKNAQNGINLAVDEINAKGGLLGKSITVVYEDSGGIPNEAVKGVNKLIQIDKVQSIIGDVTSSNILAVAPICEQNKVILLNFGVAAEITNAGDYIFRNWNSSTSDAKFTSEYALRTNNRFVVLYQNDSYGVSSKDAFVSELAKKNAQVIYTGTFERGQTDFRTLLNNVKNQSFQAIYIACYFKEALNFLKQAKELNVSLPMIFGTSEWEESTLTEFLKNNYPDRAFYGYPSPPDATLPIRKHFVEAYTQRYGKQPEILSDNGYDAVLMLQYGIEKAGSYDATKVKDALYTLKDFQGASGLMSFDSNGDVDKPFGLRNVTKSGLVWVK